MSITWKIAGYTITPLILSYFKLDGGSMFGPVPKVIWQKLMQPDERNRIQMVTRSLLIEGHGRKILLDAGCGEKWNEKERGIYDFKEMSYPDGVTDIIMTHMHFDHSGGLCRQDTSGSLIPNFNAKLHLHRINYQNAKSPKRREVASYRQDCFDSLAHYECNLIDKSSTRLFPNLYVSRTDGHTEGQLIIEISDKEGGIIFCSDTIAFYHHRHEPYHMGFDMCAEMGLREKMKILRRAAKRSFTVVFQHDPEFIGAIVSIGAVVSSDKNSEKFEFAPILDPSFK